MSSLYFSKLQVGNMNKFGHLNNLISLPNLILYLPGLFSLYIIIYFLPVHSHSPPSPLEYPRP